MLRLIARGYWQSLNLSCFARRRLVRRARHGFGKRSDLRDVPFLEPLVWRIAAGRLFAPSRIPGRSVEMLDLEIHVSRLGGSFKLL